MPKEHCRRLAVVASLTIAVTAPALALAPAAQAAGHRDPGALLSKQSSVKSLSSVTDKYLTPRTHFTMAADG